MRITKAIAATTLAAAALASTAAGGTAYAQTAHQGKQPALHINLVSKNGVLQPMAGSSLPSGCRLSLSNGDHNATLYCDITTYYGQDYYLGITGYNADGSYNFAGTTGLISESASYVSAGSDWWLDSTTAWLG